jgi:hypothetical protein
VSGDGRDQTTESIHVDVVLKSGYLNGTSITFPKKGDVLPGMEPSDLTFVVNEAPHDKYHRVGNDVLYTANITLAQALGRCELSLVHLDGRCLNVDCNRVITPNSKVIKSLLLHILKENYFDFLDKHYLQIQGTAMGTKMAPPYANIFMANLERGLTNIAPQHISIWKRFIDDIFFIWTGSMDSLVEFQHTANTLHPSIKFTFESSISEVNFLDTTVYTDESRKFRTKLFRKPTDRNLILHFDSHHPLHNKRNIVYSQALRYKRIISDPLTLKEELRTLKRIFLSRRYPPGLVAQQLKKALLIPRTSLLTDRLKNQSPPQRRRLLKLPHHPATKTVQTQVRKLWHQHIDNKEPNTTTIWSGPPRILQTTDQSLKDILMNTRTTPP